MSGMCRFNPQDNLVPTQMASVKNILTNVLMLVFFLKIKISDIFVCKHAIVFHILPRGKVNHKESLLITENTFVTL